MIDATFDRSSALTAPRATVLQNTYRLLSMTLIWSALAAYMGMLFPVGGWGHARHIHFGDWVLVCNPILQ